METTTAPETSSAGAGAYIAPGSWGNLNAAARDEQLKRYTLIFQALAAVFSIALVIWHFSKGK